MEIYKCRFGDIIWVPVGLGVCRDVVTTFVWLWNHPARFFFRLKHNFPEMWTCPFWKIIGFRQKLDLWVITKFVRKHSQVYNKCGNASKNAFMNFATLATCLPSGAWKNYFTQLRNLNRIGHLKSHVFSKQSKILKQPKNHVPHIQQPTNRYFPPNLLFFIDVPSLLDPLGGLLVYL